MKASSKKKSSVSTAVIETIKKNYDWSGKTGAILLKETISLALALEGIGYTEKQILKELKTNGNI